MRCRGSHRWLRQAAARPLGHKRDGRFRLNFYFAWGCFTKKEIYPLPGLLFGLTRQIFRAGEALSLNPAVAFRGCGRDEGGRDRCQRLAKRPAREANRSDDRWTNEKEGLAFCIW